MSQVAQAAATYAAAHPYRTPYEEPPPRGAPPLLCPRAGALRGDLPPITLSAKAEAAIMKSKVEYELALQRSGMPQPWGLVEKLADELLEELLHSGAQQLFEACDEAVEGVCDDELAISGALPPSRPAPIAA